MYEVYYRRKTIYYMKIKFSLTKFTSIIHFLCNCRIMLHYMLLSVYILRVSFLSENKQDIKTNRWLHTRKLVKVLLKTSISFDDFPKDFRSKLS